MPVNKELMHNILKNLSEIYPQRCLEPVVKELDCDDYPATIAYLYDHEMIDAYRRNVAGDIRNRYVYPVITQKGYDYLLEDGGLTAHSKTITVKIDHETIAMLIESHVIQSPMPQESKSSIVKAIRNLPGDTLKHLALKLVDQGLKYSPEALQLIEKFVRQSF